MAVGTDGCMYGPHVDSPDAVHRRCSTCGWDMDGKRERTSENNEAVHSSGLAYAGRKDDDDKAALDLLPFAALMDVASVLTYGARRYGPDNWRKVESAPGRDRYLAAALQHIFAYAGPGKQEKDPESGLPHLAHAVCCLLFMLEMRDV